MPFNLIGGHGSVEKAAGLNGCLSTFSPRTVDLVGHMTGGLLCHHASQNRVPARGVALLDHDYLSREELDEAASRPAPLLKGFPDK